MDFFYHRDEIITGKNKWILSMDGICMFGLIDG